MTCKACGQPFGCDHSDAEYQGVVPPVAIIQARRIVAADLKPDDTPGAELAHHLGGLHRDTIVVMTRAEHAASLDVRADLSASERHGIARGDWDNGLAVESALAALGGGRAI